MINLYTKGMDNPELIGWISLGVAALAIRYSIFYILQEKKANKKLKIEVQNCR